MRQQTIGRGRAASLAGIDPLLQAVGGRFRHGFGFLGRRVHLRLGLGVDALQCLRIGMAVLDQPARVVGNGSRACQAAISSDCLYSCWSLTWWPVKR